MTKDPLSPVAPPKLFDRRLIARRRALRAARFSDHNILHRRAMEDVVDRLETVTRAFPHAALVGAGGLEGMITPACGVGSIITMDLGRRPNAKTELALIGDEEALPFAPDSLDLFISLLTLHHVNDLIGALSQIRLALKPDGFFIGVLFAEETLRNLRAAFYAAEAEHMGGVSPRIAPFAAIQQLGTALSRAGFAMPVVDIDRARIRYRDPMGLIRDLRGMAETGALTDRPRPLTRSAAAEALQGFAAQGGEEQFDLVFLTGWAPAAGQPKPLKPGSAKHSLAEAVKGAKDPN